MLKFVIGFVFLLTFGYFLFFVPLGSRTLYQHLRNISDTEEAKELRDGLAEKASLVTSDVVENVPELKEMDEKVDAVRNVVGRSSTPKNKDARVVPVKNAEPRQATASSHSRADRVTHEDRAALERLIKNKM